jgi:Calcineurin-like phosphoesterase
LCLPADPNARFWRHRGERMWTRMTGPQLSSRGMDDELMSPDLVVDLLRSAWIIESARADVYRRWGEASEGSARRAEQRADIIGGGLSGSGGKTDPGLVEPHSRWVRSLIGDRSGEVPLGDLFLARVADWVDAHAGPYSGDLDGLRELGAEERQSLTFPEQLPPPPPFEPVRAVPPEPPGRVVFRFGILSDLHFGSALGDALAHAAIADLNQSGAELVIQLGDITDHGNPNEFELATKALAKLEMPVTTMLGNHDIYSIKEQRLAGREIYPASFGREPDGTVLEHKGWKFAVLDSATDAASPFPAYNLVTGSFDESPGGAVVQGSLTHVQHDILADLAAQGAGPAFVFLHHPPQPFTAFPPVLFGLRDADSGRLNAAVDSGNVWGVFAGHTHRNARTRDFDGVPAHEVAIPRDFPFGYALVEVTPRGYSYRFVQISDEELLRNAYVRAGTIHRRYALGTASERSFVWTVS